MQQDAQDRGWGGGEERGDKISALTFDRRGFERQLNK